MLRGREKTNNEKERQNLENCITSSSSTESFHFVSGIVQRFLSLSTFLSLEHPFNEEFFKKEKKLWETAIHEYFIVSFCFFLLVKTLVLLVGNQCSSSMNLKFRLIIPKYKEVTSHSLK